MIVDSWLKICERNDSPAKQRSCNDRRPLLFKPIGEDQVDQAGSPIGVEGVVADFVFAVAFAGVVAPVGLGAVEVGEVVFAGEVPGAEDASGFFHNLGIGGEGDDGAADEARRFGDHEVAGSVVLVATILVFIFSFADVPPVSFGDFEVLEDPFRAQKAGGKGDGGDAALPKFAGHRKGEADNGNLNEVVEKVAAVVEGIAVGDFEDDRVVAAFRGFGQH